jgi:ABC-type transport system involved in multi-copper enzyme maturation permease subunit
MGWVALGLLGITVGWVAAVTSSPAGWGLENRRPRRLPVTYREYGEQLLPASRYQALENSFPLEYTRQIPETERTPHPIEAPTPLDPLRDSLQSLMLSVPHTILSSPVFLKNWAFTNYTRSAMLGAYLGFLLPLFTLAYASGAIGADREARSMIWLMTRPIPRWAIYLAKFIGTLPWCLAFSGGGFVALCLAGGPLGREALGLYWPAAAAGTVAFSALFHLIGAVFRRPVVVGLVYIFFFEALVAALPGSLKLLSLTFYARSLMYNGATASGYPGGMLDVPGAVPPTTAWVVLSVATLGLTGLGMWLFTRTEYRDDV